ncbi:MAG: DUF2232 domain-containing protein [Phyllobacterium sp.]
MRISGTDIGVGILAGLAAALLTAGATGQAGLAMLLYFLSPLPIFVAALGWGTASAIAAAVSTALAISFFASPMSALLVLLTMVLPAAAASYFSGLARPAEELGGPKDSLVWFPLSDTLFRLAVITSIAFIIIGTIIGFGDELSRGLAEAFARSMTEVDPEFAADAEFIDWLASFLVTALPIIQTATWMLVLVGNFYLAQRLTAISGRLKRPRDDWPTALRMPKAAVFAFAIAIALTFLSGGIGHMAAAVAGALGTAFTLAGLAITHQRSRVVARRGLLLWALYLALMLFPFLIIPFLFIGLIDTTRTAPVSENGNANPPNNTSN